MPEDTDLAYVDAHCWVEVSRLGGTCFARLLGELDLAHAGDVLDVLDGRCGAEAEGLVVDLRHLSFLDLAGVTALLDLQARTRDRGLAFAVIPSDGRIAEVLRLTGADRRLEQL